VRLNALAGTGPLTATKVYQPDGTQADAGDVSVSVLDPNLVVASTGVATKTGAGATTAYTYVLPLPVFAQPTSDRVTWTRATGGIIPVVDTLEVSETAMFTEDDARTMTTSGLQNPLEDPVAYPDQLIASARLAIGEMFEDRTGRSWYARYCRREISPVHATKYVRLVGPCRRADGYRVAGPGAAQDLIRILACKINGDTVPLDELYWDEGGVFWSGGYFPAGSGTAPFPVVLEYVYGADPVGWEARDMALRMLRANLVPTDVSSYATSLSNEDGTFRLTAFPRQVEEWLRFHRPAGVA